MKWIWSLIPWVALGCSSISTLSESQFTNGTYRTKIGQSGGPNTLQDVYVKVTADSVFLVPMDAAGNAAGPPEVVQEGQVFHKPSFDFDVLVVIFKYRPELTSLPSQLTTDFNGNLFVGYRKDWFTVNNTTTPFGHVRKVRQRSIAAGAFAGIGTTFVSPWTTNQQTTDEYNGFIYSHGLSTMLGFKSLTFGIGVGWDYLLDRDKDIWVYQSRPWYGLTLSLNLN
jgi:hypothetical protein